MMGLRPTPTHLWLPELAGLNVASGSELLVWPLTYDDTDQNGANALVQHGVTAAPHITPDGFEGDGYSAMYTLLSLPLWLATATDPFSFHATAAISHARHSTRESIVSIADASDNPELELSVIDDGMTGGDVVAIRVGTSPVTELPLNRVNWRYEGRYPELTVQGKHAAPQAFLFLDDDTILVSAHYSDEESMVHRIRLSDGECTGRFSFGRSTHRHICSFATDQNGDLWAADYETFHTLKLNLGHSLGTQRAQILQDWDTSTLAAGSGIAFITVGGTDYVLTAQYMVSGTPLLYVFETSQMSGAVTAGDRYKAFYIPLNSQDIVIHDGKMFLSRGAPPGYIDRYDIVTAIQSAADLSALSAEASWVQASRFPECLDFRPSDGRLWTMTEGWDAVASDDGWTGIWSSALDGTAEENNYLIDYDGTDVEVRLNGHLFQTLSGPIVVDPEVLAIGGFSTQSAGWTNGFFSGHVSSVALKDGPLSASEYANLYDGTFEPNSLTSYVVSITNPGAEAGDTSGWTDESGTITVRTTSPSPHSGSYYFCGTGGTAGVARQRFLLETVTGLSTSELDALIASGDLWGRLKWWQASFDASTDPGCCGLRYLDTTPTELTLEYTGSLAIDPALSWRWRSLPSLASTDSRYIDIVQRRDYSAGTNVDCYVDDLELTLYARSGS